MVTGFYNVLDTQIIALISTDAGETRSRLAENLAPQGVYLVVKNTGLSQADVKVWVE